MGSHGSSISGGAASWQANTLSDVDDDGCEAIFVEVDLLMIGDLANGAVCVSILVQMGAMKATYLMSVKVDGRSTISAPPKSGVLRNVAIFGLLSSEVFVCEGGLR